jgi:hypothetical protein
MPVIVVNSGWANGPITRRTVAVAREAARLSPLAM